MSLLKKSEEVILDCCQENGSIVAANTDRPDYPHQVQSYRYVWPRDCAYICHALNLIGKNDEQADFFRWLDRVEDLKETGLLFQNYYTNGRKRWLGLQIDQNGSILWALFEFIKKNPKFKNEFLPLVRVLAEGICSVWKDDHFTISTQDLWERFFTYPETKSTLTYSLAACIHGLRCANELAANARWLKIAEEMKKKIDMSYHGFFLRRDGIVHDYRPDLSVLGLVWPFQIYEPDDDRMLETVKKIHETLEHEHGFVRYMFDDYDCFRYQGTDARRGAGTWPIGSYWMSIYYSVLGNAKKARTYSDKVNERLDENQNIPEQFFDNNIQVSVKPLAWSHAMQIIAQDRL